MPVYWPKKKKEDKTKNNTRPTKGAVKRSKAIGLYAMPQVAEWLNAEVERLGLSSRSDWLEYLWKQSLKKPK